jgi:hypothetical protein
MGHAGMRASMVRSDCGRSVVPLLAPGPAGEAKIATTTVTGKQPAADLEPNARASVLGSNAALES